MFIVSKEGIDKALRMEAFPSNVPYFQLENEKCLFIAVGREVFSGELKGRSRGEVSNVVAIDSFERASLYLGKIRRITIVDT
jgi:hypothetical protein